MKLNENGKVELLDKDGSTLEVDSVDAFEILNNPNSTYKLKPEAPAEEAKKKAAPSFDYAIKKRDPKSGKPKGRALKICDEKEQADQWLEEKGFDAKDYAIEERLRK